MSVTTNTKATCGAGGSAAALASSVSVIGLAYITGVPAVGDVLTANTVSGLTGTSWQWTSNGTNIGGATSQTYTVQAGDVGNTIAVVVNGLLTSVGVLIVSSYYFPSMAVGINGPTDLSYSPLWMFNNRAYTNLAANAPKFQNFTTPGSSSPPTLDANGFPTEQFSVRLDDGNVAALTQGNWFIQYTSASQRTVTSYYYTATITNVTYNNDTGVGTMLVSNPGAAAMHLTFDGAVTDLQFYPPAYNTGVGVPFWNPQFIRIMSQYKYIRFMDMQSMNTDYMNIGNSTWNTQVNWSDRITPSTVYLNGLGAADGHRAGLPLEWMLDLCAQTSLPGWWNITTLASDSFVTSYVTMIATNTATLSLPAYFECIGNEDWNSSVSFYCYHKAGAAALTEILYAQGPTATIFYNYSQRCVSIASDGTTATLITLNPHGATTGNTAVAYGLQPGYTGFAPTGTITVVDAYTVTYPCTQANTGGAVAGTTIFGTATSGVGAGIALNAGTGGSSLYYGNVTGAYLARQWWFFRRSAQVAALVKTAWVAAGRSLSDLHIIMPHQAGSTYNNVFLPIQTFINTVQGAPVSSLYTAACVGGYMALTGNQINTGFGYSWTPSSVTSEADIINYLTLFTNAGYAAYAYGSFAYFCKSNGLQMFGYEFGVETSTVPAGQTTNAGLANTDPTMQTNLQNWYWNAAELGFTKIGHFNGTVSVTQGGSGCYSLGAAVTEVDPLHYPSGSSYKYKAIVDVMTTTPTLPITRHAVPCTLSGYDCVGNEAVITVGGAWPNFGSTNLPYSAFNCPGPNNNGITYVIWSDTAKTTTFTLSGYSIGGTAIVVTATNANNSSIGTFTVATGQGSAASPVSLGSCSLTLVQGYNYILVTGAVSQRFNCFLSSLQFT